MRTAFALWLAVWTGCVHPSAEGFHAPELPAAFSDSGTYAMPDRWWTAFEDEELNRRIEMALSENLELKEIWHRLQEARAVKRRASSGLFPDLNAFVEGRRREEDSEDGEDSRDALELGLTSSYELDLWGRIRAGVEAEDFRVDATRADVQAAVLSVSAAITVVWVQLLEADLQRALVTQQIEANEKVLRLLKNRLAGGQVRGVDILRQEQLVLATRQEKIDADTRFQVFHHQLAVLMGRSPREAVSNRPRPLPALPPLPETGLPAELITRRPDVRSAWFRLEAANREVAAAVMERYPRLTLSASIGTEDTEAERLFESSILSLAGRLAAPLLDAGRRKADVARSQSVVQQRLADYGQRILVAFQEVEDALILERQQRARIDTLKEQVRLAGLAYEQLQVEYMNGQGNFIDVLSSLTDEQAVQRDLLAARRRLLEFRIALYRALAGGLALKDE